MKEKQQKRDASGPGEGAPVLCPVCDKEIGVRATNLNQINLHIDQCLQLTAEEGQGQEQEEVDPMDNLLRKRSSGSSSGTKSASAHKNDVKKRMKTLDSFLHTPK